MTRRAGGCAGRIRRPFSAHGVGRAAYAAPAAVRLATCDTLRIGGPGRLEGLFPAQAAGAQLAGWSRPWDWGGHGPASFRSARLPSSPGHRRARVRRTGARPRAGRRRLVLAVAAAAGSPAELRDHAGRPARLGGRRGRRHHAVHRRRGRSGTTQTSSIIEPLADVTFTDAQHGCAVGGSGWDSYYEGSPLMTSVILYTTDAGATLARCRAAVAPGARCGHVRRRAVRLGGRPPRHDPAHRGRRRHVDAPALAYPARPQGGPVHRCATRLRRRAMTALFVWTDDGGLTWARQTGRCSRFFWHDVNSLAMDGAGTLWASFGSRGSSGEFDRLARSADGGLHWRTVDLGWDYNVWDIAADGARLIGVGPVDETGPAGTSRVVSSADGGATWQTRVLGQGLALTSVALGGSGNVCAVGSGTASSVDGLTWAATGLPSAGTGSLDFASATEGWATGYGGEAWFGYGGNGGAVERRHPAHVGRSHVAGAVRRGRHPVLRRRLRRHRGRLGGRFQGSHPQEPGRRRYLDRAGRWGPRQPGAGRGAQRGRCMGAGLFGDRKEADAGPPAHDGRRGDVACDPAAQGPYSTGDALPERPGCLDRRRGAVT